MKDIKKHDGTITSSNIKAASPNKSYNTKNTNYKDINDINPNIPPNQKR